MEKKKEKQILALISVLLVLFLFYSYSNGNTIITKNKIADMQALAKNWLLSNLQESPPLFLYSLNYIEDKETGSNNAIRQLMASRILAKEANANKILLQMHRANINYILNNWFETKDDIGFVVFKNKSKLGSSAMLLRTLLASPDFDSYKKEARYLANGILEMQKADGSFSAWFIKPNYKYDEQYLLTFYSGEALLALVEYYEKTGDDKYIDAVLKSADFYIDKYAKNIDKNYYPAYVPWHTMALSKLYKIFGDKKYSEAIFVMNDKLLELQDKATKIGRFYNPNTPQYGKPHSSSDAIYTEGLAYAYEIALLVKDYERGKKYENAIKISLGNIISLQILKINHNYKAPPYKYIGAIRIREDSEWIRVDTTQHTIDMFDKIMELSGKNI